MVGKKSRSQARKAQGVVSIPKEPERFEICVKPFDYLLARFPRPGVGEERESMTKALIEKWGRAKSSHAVMTTGMAER